MEGIEEGEHGTVPVPYPYAGPPSVTPAGPAGRNPDGGPPFSVRFQIPTATHFIHACRVPCAARTRGSG